MSHNIEYYDFPNSTNRKKIFADLDAHVRAADFQEGGSLGKIRWEEGRVFSSYDEAQQYIESMRYGSYINVAVPYIDCRGNETKKLAELKAQCEKLEMDLHREQQTLFFKDFKVEFIGCKHCGSKLNRKYLRSEQCPICGESLCSETLMKKRQRMYERMQVARKKYQEEMIVYTQKHSTGNKVRWLVKIEYHT